MKRVYMAVLSALLLYGSVALAEPQPWLVVADEFDQTIHVIDLFMDPPAVYGPFLAGQLGTGGVLLDVAITPDHHYALVSNFDANTVYRIDLRNPTSPVVTGSVDIGFPPEDIAIAPNSQFALLTDGGNESRFAILDLPTFKLKATYTLTTPNAGAQAIAIGLDSQTVVICDFYNNRIIYGILDPNTGLVTESILPTGQGPMNAAISPDGKTLLVANIYTDTVNVFQITAPGVIQQGANPTVSGLPGGQQSIAFAPDGKRAYVVSVASFPDQLSYLQVNSPGNVILGLAGAANLLSNTDCGFFGVDVLAITPDGKYALVGNPCDEGSLISQQVSNVDLSNWDVTSINTNSQYPIGLAIADNTYVPPRVPSMTPLGAIICAGVLAGFALYQLRRPRRS
jgi:6-phosphogluconolactonase (cycloisomerase 2 family)